MFPHDKSVRGKQQLIMLTSNCQLPTANCHLLLSRWREGTTGLPLVDANMRELAATGFMSNRCVVYALKCIGLWGVKRNVLSLSIPTSIPTSRGRQNVASFLVLDLGVDWRRGADYFENVLLDYDVRYNCL